MLKKDIQKFNEGTKTSRHFQILKWMFVCLVIAAIGFSVEYFFKLPSIGYFVTAFGVIGGNILMIIGMVNFFSNEPSVEDQYKNPKQPWE